MNLIQIDSNEAKNKTIALLKKTVCFFMPFFYWLSFVLSQFSKTDFYREFNAFQRVVQLRLREGHRPWIAFFSFFFLGWVFFMNKLNWKQKKTATPIEFYHRYTHTHNFKLCINHAKMGYYRYTWLFKKKYWWNAPKKLVRRVKES